jgi:hypothetical protein
MSDNQLSSVLDKLGAVKDTMTVSRVFGESRRGHHRPGCHRARRWRGWRWRRNRTRRGRHGHRRRARIRRDRSAPRRLHRQRRRGALAARDRRVTRRRRWAAPRSRRHPRPPSPAQAPLRTTLRATPIRAAMWSTNRRDLPTSRRSWPEPPNRRSAYRGSRTHMCRYVRGQPWSRASFGRDVLCCRV